MGINYCFQRNDSLNLEIQNNHNTKTYIENLNDENLNIHNILTYEIYITENISENRYYKVELFLKNNLFLLLNYFTNFKQDLNKIQSQIFEKVTIIKKQGKDNILYLIESSLGIVIDFKKGNIYIGELLLNKPNGNGLLINIQYETINKNKIIYDYFKSIDENFINLEYINYFYVGDFNNGVRQGGLGKEFYLNIIYEGEFSKNIRNGNGKIILSSSENIEGIFVDGVLKAITKGYLNENYYEGKIKNGCGKAKIIYKDKSLYFGNIKNFMKNGFGTYYFDETNLNYYIGNWKNGKMHGNGIIFQKNMKREGIWRFGKKIK